MSISTMTVRTKLAVAATAVAAAALPFQAGVAHASTPNDDLNACITNAVATMGDSFDANVDACVDAYLVELGIDPNTDTMTSADTGTADVTSTDDSGGVVNTAILGTADSDTSASTADAATM